MHAHPQIAKDSLSGRLKACVHFHPLFDRDDDDDQDGCSDHHEDDHHEGIYLLVSSFSRASVDWPAVVAAICLAFTWRY